jgi:hypothetical protein
VSNFDHRIGVAMRHDVPSRSSEGTNMSAARAFVDRQPVESKRYTMAELYELRRVIIRYSRSFPPGPVRNKHRQIASSMRSLGKDKPWLAAHTVDGI